MNTRPTLGLPHDVLLIVASFADRKCLLALLTACRSLHTDCGKYVLQDPVALHGNRDIVSFIYFMRPHKCKRWHHLHTLCLRDGSISSHVAEELARVIPLASHLQSLEFEDAEETLGAHPDLALAFAAIRTIKHIIIEHGYRLTCWMLETSLESAVLRHTSYKPEWQGPDVLDRMHPAALLKNSRTTLRTLECDAWCDCSLILHTYPIYPKLESFSVGFLLLHRRGSRALHDGERKELTYHTSYSAHDTPPMAESLVYRTHSRGQIKQADREGGGESGSE